MEDPSPDHRTAWSAILLVIGILFLIWLAFHTPLPSEHQKTRKINGASATLYDGDDEPKDLDLGNCFSSETGANWTIYRCPDSGAHLMLPDKPETASQ